MTRDIKIWAKMSLMENINTHEMQYGMPETFWAQTFWLETFCPMLSFLETLWSETFWAETFWADTGKMYSNLCGMNTAVITLFYTNSNSAYAKSH